jgi:SOS-response transcriptional repressor LexA
MRLDNGLLEPCPRLTPRQLEVLRFIWTFFQEAETYPTHREIATAIGAQSTNVAPWLNALEKKGVIARPARGMRNIRLTREGLRALHQAGVIPAGEQLEL